MLFLFFLQFDDSLAITHKSAGIREPGLLEAFALQILRCAQDDSSLALAVILSAAKDL